MARVVRFVPARAGLVRRTSSPSGLRWVSIARARTAAGMTSSSPPRVRDTAARVTDYTGDPGRLAPSKDFLYPLEGLAPGRSGTRSPKRRQTPACALGPREPRTPARVRPNVARIAEGGEPGEKGATKTGTCLSV